MHTFNAKCDYFMLNYLYFFDTIKGESNAEYLSVQQNI